jgi:hypothetical protein
MDESVELLCFGMNRVNQVFAPEILQEAERQVQVIREKLKLAQSR